MRTILFLGLLLGLPVCAGAQRRVTASQQPDTVARAALQTFARLVNRQNFRAFGFESADEIRSAALGVPLREFMVRLDELRAYTPGANPDPLVHPVDRVIYPVLVRGAVRSSLTLARTGDAWGSYGFGDPGFVRSLEDLRVQLSAREGAAPATFTLLRIPAVNMAFLARTAEQRLVLFPLVDDARFNFRRGAPVTAAEAFARLAPTARAHNGLPT